MRRICKLLAIVVVATSSLQHGTAHANIPNPCGARPCIQIGTFNIEWFGGPNHKPRPRKVVKQLADFIADTLDLEVVVLEEINTASQEYKWLGQELAKYGYRLDHAGDTATQDVALAFDEDEVELLGDVRELDVRSNFDLPGNCRSKGLRRPLAAHLKAGAFDFALLGIHLKSQLGVKEADDPDGCADEVRGQQAGDISGKIEEIVNGMREQDVIIAGDFNATLDNPSLSPLFKNGGFRALTSLGMRARESNTYSYVPKKFRSLIDHLLIRTAKTREWVNRSTFVMNPPTDQAALNNYLEWFSDHLPVWAWFRTDRADDD